MCVWGKGDDAFASPGIARYSVRPWRVCVELIQELINLVQVSDQRGTCIV